MKAITIVAAIALAGCATSPVRRPATAFPTAVPDLASAVDSIMSAYADPHAPGASVLVVRDGSTVLARSYGMANVEAGEPATVGTNYRLASLTKQFTATAIMLLKEDGRLRYDDAIEKYLPQLPPSARGVTIRMLLTHTSGLWAYEDFVSDSQPQVHDADVPALIARADSTYFPPGSAYRYSNTGYALLALIVERVSAKPFATFLHERIFAPLGMAGTVAHQDGVSTIARRAFGYAVDPNGVRRSDQSSTSAVLGDGGVYSSVNDLARWDGALDAHTLVTEADQREAWTSAVTTRGSRVGYGFGWFVDSASDGPRLRHHGETTGFTNAILKIPARRLTIVILTNRTGGEPWDLATRIAALPALR